MTQAGPSHHKILILGAGPAGLAMGGRLRHAGLDFHIVERSDRVAYRWHHHYDRLHLHTVKRLSHLPHLPFPDNYPRYVSRQQLVDYFKAYAQKFSITPQFGVHVTAIRKRGNGFWHIEARDTSFTANHVVIATGVNNLPNKPDWPGRETFNGRIVHSVDYRNSSPFLGRRVLVVGMGNTGAEIALDLAEQGIQTWISVRSPVSIIPRDIFGHPVQESGRLLEKLPFDIGARVGAVIQRLYLGDLSRYGLRKPSLPPAHLLRKTAKTPVVDIGTVNAIKQGRIQVVGAIKDLSREHVILDNGDSFPVDDIILATGYRHTLRDMVERMETFLDPLGYPQGPVGVGFHAGLYFVGFNNYALGGILGTIFSETQTVTEHLQAGGVGDAGTS